MILDLTHWKDVSFRLQIWKTVISRSKIWGTTILISSCTISWIHVAIASWAKIYANARERGKSWESESPQMLNYSSEHGITWSRASVGTSTWVISCECWMMVYFTQFARNESTNTIADSIWASTQWFTNSCHETIIERQLLHIIRGRSSLLHEWTCKACVTCNMVE